MRTLVSLVKTRINCSLASCVQPKLLHPVMHGWPGMTCCDVVPCVRNLQYELFYTGELWWKCFSSGSTEHQSFTKRILYFQLQEINTLDDKKVEFFDDKNKLIWFLQPQEAQFYLVAETLRHKPKASLVRTKLPFKPRTMSRMNLNRKWPELHEIQEYLRRLKAAELTRGEGENGRLALKNRKK